MENITREDLRKVEKQKRIIYQKIAIMLIMKNIQDVTKDKLETILRKSDDFSQNELDLVFGKTNMLKEEQSKYYQHIEFKENNETKPYILAKESRLEREREYSRSYGFVPEYI